MRTGGCQCGAVRYRLTAEPQALYVCHCSECRRQSASAFGISVYVASKAVTVERGTPKVWSRPADSGDTVFCYFCPDCGSRLWHISRSAPRTISIKGGTLDDPPDLSRAIHVWTESRLHGVPIPARAESHAREPE